MHVAQAVLSCVIALALLESPAGGQRESGAARPPVRLVGTLIDSISGAPVAEARIAVEGTTLTTSSDTDGRFAIAGVTSGIAVIAIHTASLDSVKAVHRARVTAGGAAPIQIRVPTSRQVTVLLCGDAPLVHQGIVVGSVEAPGDSAPARDARVVAEWSDQSASGTRKQSAAARTNDQGAFRVCGIPVDTTVFLRADVPGMVAVPFTLRIPANGRVVRARLTVGRDGSTPAAFAGVVTDTALQPIPGAEVVLLDVGKTATTDGGGAFHIVDVPAGEHAVEVRRLGYGAAEFRLKASSGETVERAIRLSRVVALDSVVVKAPATPAIPSFEEHRRLGLGDFLTREQLQRQQGRRMSDVLQQVSGLRVTNSGAAAWVSSTRAVQSLSSRCPEREDEPGGIVARRARGEKVACTCYPVVYLNTTVIYRGGDGGVVPNVNRFEIPAIEAIEFFATAAQTPPEYSVLNSSCGLLVFHTRRTP